MWHANGLESPPLKARTGRRPMSDDVHKVRAFEHPGEGRKRAKSTPKGRQIDPRAAEEVSALLGDRARRRDLLIEHLHLIQDRYRQISAAHLAALADEMK